MVSERRRAPVNAPRAGLSISKHPLRRSVAVLATAGLAWAVATYGVGLFPPEPEPLRLIWDFRDATTPIWDSPNSQALRSSEGMMLVPAAEIPVVASGALDHAPEVFGRLRLRLSVRDPARGQVGLVLRSGEDIDRVLVPFDVRGGGAFEDITVPLPVDHRLDRRVVQVALVPSNVPQSAVVAWIRFEPDEAALKTALRELFSPAPGKSASLYGTAVNSFPPPIIAGRSAWLALIPAVLCFGLIARFARGHTRLRTLVRRLAWGAVGSVWALGFILLVYHQVVALAADVESFGGRSRDESYAVTDGVPLWNDLQEVARLLPQGAVVEFVTDAGGDAVGSALWKARASYYLYPVRVRPGAPVSLRYVGAPHPPCAQIAPQHEILQEAARYCLFRVGP